VVVRWLVSVGVNGFGRRQRSGHSGLVFARSDRGGEQAAEVLVDLQHAGWAHPEQASDRVPRDVPQLAAFVVSCSARQSRRGKNMSSSIDIVEFCGDPS
jgi:hypothetical protein